MDKILDKIGDLKSAMTPEILISIFSIISILILFGYLVKLVKKVDRDEKTDWTDIIKDKSNHISLSKVIQLIGSTISSWIVVKLTLQEKLSWDIFSLYLMYCAGTEGFSKYLSAKYGITAQDKKKELEKDSES